MNVSPSPSNTARKLRLLNARANAMSCWCGGPATQPHFCGYQHSEPQCMSVSNCFWQCQSRGGGGGQVIIIGDGSDAGDAAAVLIGNIFTFFLWLGLAGCCCACCAVRYCMLKASQTSEQAGGAQAPTTWVGWMRSVVRHRLIPPRLSLPKLQSAQPKPRAGPS